MVLCVSDRASHQQGSVSLTWTCDYYFSHVCDYYFNQSSLFTSMDHLLALYPL